jgi:drug/metabolite transporter (DMT)-like permease
MSRLRADCCLLLTAVIWGFAFIAQKTAMHGIGPFTFLGSRFFLSALAVLPFAARELRRHGPVVPRHFPRILLLCLTFAAGAFLQQFGVMRTTVTHAGFYTGLYVIFVPFVAWFLFRRAPSRRIWVACLMAVAGGWLLNDAASSWPQSGDLFVIACAAAFGTQVALMGWILEEVPLPLTLSVLQYALCAVIGWACALRLETPHLAGFVTAAIPVLYAGFMSGGIAYTLQAVAQRHSPPAAAAVILSSEAIFAALGGRLLLGETLTPLRAAGCLLIVAAILQVEAGPALIKSLAKRRSL